MAPLIYPATKLDSDQVIQYVYDEATQTLRTTATAVIVGQPIEVEINMVDDSVRLGDGTTFFTSTTIGPKTGLDVSIINTVPISGSITVTNFPTTVDTNYGVVGASTLRTAAQIGNSTGAADFGSGTSSAQTLRVVLPTNQGAIPVTQSGTWTVQPGNTPNTVPWLVTDSSDGPVSPGTAAIKSSLAGGQFNTVPPTLTNGQQSALQVDSAGRLLVDTIITNTNDTNYGVVGSNTLRTASQIGNATGAASFGAGITNAQTLRVVLPTDQSSIPVLATQSGTWNINNISGTISLPTGAATSALQTTGNTSLASIDSKLNTLGQKVSASSVPVVIASDQSPITVTGTITTSPNVNIHDAAGNNLTSQVNGSQRALDVGINVAGVQIDPRQIRALTAADVVTANAGTGNFTVVQPTGTNLHVVVDSGTIAATQSGTWNINNISGTVSLPTGASTSALQTSGNTSLSSIDSKTPALGQALMAASSPVVIASNQSAIPVTQSTSPWVVSGTVAVSNLPTTVDTNYGTVGASTIRTAAQIGNATGAAAFNAGTTTAQTLRVVLPTDQTAIPATQSGTWTTGRTWTLASGTDSVAAVQSGTWNINNISGTISLPTGAATSALQTTGNTSLASIVTNTNSLILAQGSTTSGQTGNLSMGATTTSAPTYTTGQTNALSLTTAGALRTDSSATTQPISGSVSVSNFPATQAVTQSTSPWITKDQSDGPVTPGTVASFSQLIGGQFNTALPTLTNGQQAAVQVDSSGRLLVAGTISIPDDTNYGTVGANTLRTASQIGNATGAALFGAGTTTAQVLRVVLPTDQTAIPVTQSTSPWVVSGTVAATQSGTWNINNISGTVSLPTGAATEVTLAKLPLAQSSTTSGQSGVLELGAVTTAAPTYTTGQSNPLSLTTSGALRVDGSGSTQPVSGTVTANQGTSPWVVSGTVTANAGTGNFTVVQATGTNLHAVIDSGTIAATQSGTWTTGRTWTLASGTDSVSSVQSGTWTVQPGNTANTTPWLVTDSSDGPVTPGTVAAKSSLAGGQFNTTPPTLTNGQQAALQVDSAGRLLVDAAITNTNDTNYGTVGANTLRTASQIGNSAGAALFGAGTTTAQVLRVVLPTDQTAIPASQSGTWTTGRTWTLASGTDSIASVQSGTWNINNISGTISLPTGAATEATLAKLPVGQASTTSGQSGPLIQGAVTTASPAYTTAQTSPLSLTTAGALRVDGSGSTQPVSGTVTANQGGTWNINNISGTVSLPTGAATSVLQTTGNTSLASIVTNTNGLALAQGSTTSGQTGNLNFGAVTTAAPTYITAQSSPLSLTTAGALRTDSSGTTQPISGTVSVSGTVAVTQSTSPWVVSGTVTANNASVSTTGTAPPASATYIGGSVTTAAPGYTTGQMNALSLNTSGGLRVDGSGVTQPVSGTVTANQGGTWNINNISGTISLPTGAATETTLAKLPLAQASTTSGQSGVLQLGAVTTAAPAYTTAQSSPLSLTTGGLLRVDASGTTITVSGTITANQGGTWNINNISGTISLPTGAATSALQTTGNTSLASIVTNTNSLILAQGSTTSGQTGNLIMGAVTTAAPTYTTAQTSPLSLTTSGALRTDASATTQPVSGTVTANQGGTWTVQQGTPPWTVVGNVASAAADSGNPIKTGAIYNSTIPTFSTGQRTDSQSDVNGRQIVNIGSGGQSVAGGISTNGGTASLNTQGMSTVGIDLTGTFVATIVIEGQFGDGVYTPISSMNAVTGAFATTYTAPAFIIVPCGGYAQIRLRASAYTSGTANVQLNSAISNNIVSLNPLNNTMTAVGNVASGATDSGNPVKVGGVFNTALPTLTTGQRGDLQLDSNARVIISPLTNSSIVKSQLQDNAGTGITSTVVGGKQGLDTHNADNDRQTYSAIVTNLATALTATDIFTITGSGTKTIRVTRLEVYSTETTGGVINVLLIKRSTANTAGTSAASTAIPHDSNNAAATATVLSYTANPTLGTAVGTLRSGKVTAVAVTGTETPIIWDFGIRNDQAVVLRGTTQVLAVNLNSATITGSSFSISIEWSEE